MKVKNICFTYITPFHPERGGIGRVTHTLTLEFQRRGYNVFYLIYPCAMTVRHEYDYPAPLEYLPSSKCLSEENLNYYFDYLKRNEIDVVINQSGNFNDSELWCKARELDIKVISVLHSTPSVAYDHLFETEVFPLRSNKLIEKVKRVARILLYPRIRRNYWSNRVKQFEYVVPNSDIVCCLSKNYYQDVKRLYKKSLENLYAIENPNSFSSVELQTEKPKTKTILFVGLFSEPKKEIDVLKLWKRIYRDFKDWNLIMVGSGSKDRVEKLKKFAKKLERVDLVGLRPAIDYMKSASILVMTSGYEGWPMVITEAMQCGTVPMAFNSFASVKDIIKDEETGYLIKPFDLNEYEKKLRQLMSDEILRKKFSDSAILHVANFDVNKIVDKWERLFCIL